MVRVSGDSDVTTKTVSLIPGDWTHAWYEMSDFRGQTVLVDFGFMDPTGAEQIYLDEISLGAAKVGVFGVYLPVVCRSSMAAR